MIKKPNNTINYNLLILLISTFITLLSLEIVCRFIYKPPNLITNTKECYDDVVFLLAECVNGKINGSVKIWNVDGKLSSNATWTDDSPFNSLEYEWHKNGTLKKEVGYIAGDLIHSNCWDNSGNEIKCPESNDKFRYKRSS